MSLIAILANIFVLVLNSRYSYYWRYTVWISKRNDNK